jgi:hypothetical protein
LWDKDYYDKSIGKFTKAIDLASNPEISTWANLSWGEVLREQGHPNTDVSIFPKNSLIFWTLYLWQRVLTYLNHQLLTHWGLRPKRG